jgi:hypothetical protein
VPANLIEQLTERLRDRAVRHRVVMHREPLGVSAQIRHHGPVWLDRLKAESLAPYGFGAELRQAIAQRREVLRQIGVRPDDPNRGAQLRELERMAVGRGREAATGQRFLARVPDDGAGVERDTATCVTTLDRSVRVDGGAIPSR